MAGAMMRISTKGRYALRMMLDVAQHAQGGTVSLRDIAERQQVTTKYMESIMALLLREKLVMSVRGKSGGYRLTREPSAYTVYEILSAAEGDLSPVACLSATPQGCELRRYCATLPLWQGLDNVIRTYLENITLADLIRKDEGDLTFCDGI